MVDESKKEEPTIHSADFVKGITGTDGILKDGVPQVAFVGRSNVGKSSAINVLLGRKSLAKSSSTPGKTSEINFFLVNEDRYFVDLPGYGYAKVKPQIAEKFRKRIIWYLAESEAHPETVVLILDVRRGLTDNDRDLIEIVIDRGFPLLIIANKVDKLNQKERHKALRSIHKDLEVYGIEADSIVPFSAQTKEGKSAVLALLLE